MLHGLPECVVHWIFSRGQCRRFGHLAVINGNVRVVALAHADEPTGNSRLSLYIRGTTLQLRSTNPNNSLLCSTRILMELCKYPFEDSERQERWQQCLLYADVVLQYRISWILFEKRAYLIMAATLAGVL